MTCAVCEDKGVKLVGPARQGYCDCGAGKALRERERRSHDQQAANSITGGQCFDAEEPSRNYVDQD